MRVLDRRMRYLDQCIRASVAVCNVSCKAIRGILQLLPDIAYGTEAAHSQASVLVTLVMPALDVIDCYGVRVHLDDFPSELSFFFFLRSRAPPRLPLFPTRPFSV